jgi:hypothetical protein
MAKSAFLKAVGEKAGLLPLGTGSAISPSTAPENETAANGRRFGKFMVRSRGLEPPLRLKN